MVSYEWYKYVELRQVQNSKKPTHLHVWCETQAYGIFFPDSTNTDTWLKTTDEGTTIETVATCPDSLPINSFFLDEDNDKLYYVAGELDDNGNVFRCRYIDLSDDSDNHIISYDAGANIAGMVDCFVDSTGDFWYVYFREDPGPVISFRFYNHTDSAGFNQAIGDPTARSFDISFGILVGDDYYFLHHWSDENVELWKADLSLSSCASVDDLGAGTAIPSNVSQRGIAYDGSDLLYFFLDVGGSIYLYSYSISLDTSTQLQEVNAALMRNRHCLSTSGSPWEFEKGFHISSSYVYQITRSYEYLLKLQDLSLTGGETIIAISDKYLITSNSDLYEYTDSIDEFRKAIVTYDINKRFIRGKFESTTLFATDQLVELYENNEDSYTLCFRGKMGLAQHKFRRGKDFYSYAIKNFGWDDLQEKVTYSASATGGDETVIALVGQLTNPYIYCDATSVPNIATTITYEFDDIRLIDALYVCCILLNGYFWIEPNGYLYFSTYAAASQSKWYLGSGGLNYDPVGTSSTTINWVDSATLYDGSCVIVESWQSHNNIIRLLDDATAGEDPIIYHTITQATSGIFEFYIGTNDTNESWHIRLYEDATLCVHLRIEATDFDYYSGGAWNEAQDAIANDTMYHIKIQWYSGTPDTFDVYVDGTLKVDGVANRNNQVSGINSIAFSCHGDSTDYLYIDAPGLVGEVDPKNKTYVEGYNLYDSFNNTLANMSNPKIDRVQQQYNDFSGVKGGWNEAANTYFTPTTPTNAAHILQYGKRSWKDITFSGARTQAALDAIITALKAWQGIDENPLNATFNIMGRYYDPIGCTVHVAWTERSLITAADLLVYHKEIDFKRPGRVKIGCTENIVW